MPWAPPTIPCTITPPCRAVHNITIIAPADNFETRETIKAIHNTKHPVYVRLGKALIPHVHAEGSTFTIGKAALIRDGNDLSFIACGETVPIAAAAAELLAAHGVECRVLSMHTIKPLDDLAVRQAAHDTLRSSRSRSTAFTVGSVKPPRPS